MDEWANVVIPIRCIDRWMAFVSMGGHQDGSGTINASLLIEIIKNQFEMTIDIEKLIEELDEDGSGEIEYNEFKALLDN